MIGVNNLYRGNYLDVHARADTNTHAPALPWRHETFTLWDTSRWLNVGSSSEDNDPALSQRWTFAELLSLLGDNSHDGSVWGE